MRGKTLNRDIVAGWAAKHGMKTEEVEAGLRMVTRILTFLRSLLILAITAQAVMLAAGGCRKMSLGDCVALVSFGVLAIMSYLVCLDPEIFPVLNFPRDLEKLNDLMCLAEPGDSQYRLNWPDYQTDFVASRIIAELDRRLDVILSINGHCHDDAVDAEVVKNLAVKLMGGFGLVFTENADAP